MLKLSLPIPFQNLTLQIQRILPRTLDRMQLSRSRQVLYILPTAIKYLRSFRYIHNTMHHKVTEVCYSERYFPANTIQRSCTNAQIHIPFNTVPTRLKIDRIEVIFVPEQHLKRRRVFIALFDAALLYCAISEEYQQ